MKFHPAAQIVTWCLLVVSMQAMTQVPLLFTASFILLGAFLISRQKFLQLVRRTRWIMLSLLLIYAYSTPGQTLSDSLGMLSPSREGLLEGMVQLTRLTTALASLAILLNNLSRLQLIAGLHSLFAPLQLVGLSKERLAVRLALTLHYAEEAVMRGSDAWQDSLRSLYQNYGNVGDSTLIELPKCRFLVSDMLLLASAALLLVVTMQ